jgi:hypothetical protein
MHGDLFDGPIPGPQPEPAWPGYDKVPAVEPKTGLLAKLFRRRTARHAA